MPEAGTQLPLSVAAERVAGELEGLYGNLERLEYGLDMVFVHTSEALGGQTITMLQELDMLRQSLGALADFLSQLARETDATGTVDTGAALRCVPLRDMAIRLGGEEKSGPVSGHAELF
ncbi:chemotaxis protein [Sagittula salina]|uniref:Chemotaxis protein n=1 Tax=Sagittula salina TaxID=2820268 RepID=A0A940MH29_9RHOB|nr:chemotaxis protein [Sagittula salina]MBP0481391.1 chemotaxis protein [Sagittula salina]